MEKFDLQGASQFKKIIHTLWSVKTIIMINNVIDWLIEDIC